MEGGAISAELEVEGQQTFSREGATPWTVVTQKQKTKGMTIPILLWKKRIAKFDSPCIRADTSEATSPPKSVMAQQSYSWQKKSPCHSVDATYTSVASHQVIMALPGLLGIAGGRRRCV